MLAPDIPLGGMHYDLYMATKFGSKGRASSVKTRIRDIGREAGISFDFSKIKTMPPSSDVHRLMLYAERHNRLLAVLDFIFRAYFEQGRDIESHVTLIETAKECGLDGQDLRLFLSGDEHRNTVQNRAFQAISLGIQGVPTFIFEDTYLVSGAMDMQSLLRPIDVATANRQVEPAV